MPNKILVINGPNLNLLDKRPAKIYGGKSLQDIEKRCLELALENNLKIEFKQSNHEGEIVGFIQDAIGNFDGIIINAAAYTHTSVAIRDALEIFSGKKIELHISNIFAREKFRHKSTISEIVDAVISGLGTDGYEIALLGIQKLINSK